MAQSYTGETIESGDWQIESMDVMIGDRDKSRFLYYQLKMSMQKAKQIDIIVSFLLGSGVWMILKDLRFYNEKLKCYSENWRKPSVSKDWAKYDSDKDTDTKVKRTRIFIID